MRAWSRTGRVLRLATTTLAIALMAAACGAASPATTPERLLATSVPATVPPPTPTPTPRVTPLPLEVTKASFTDKVAHSGSASVSVHTEPQAKCSIEVLYDSGPSKASGLDPKTASSGGKVIWSWKVGANTAAGTYPITVICKLPGHEGTLELDFTVTR
jgi:hypothetical protein